MRSLSSITPYFFLVWCLIKRRDNVTFTLRLVFRGSGAEEGEMNEKFVFTKALCYDSSISYLYDFAVYRKLSFQYHVKVWINDKAGEVKSSPRLIN
jgi:hypothetical protein